MEQSTHSERSGGSRLLERERALALIGRCLAEAQAGSGRVVLIRANAGLGKTALLGRVVDSARRQEMQVLAARGSELEQRMPFGVARQLFESPVRDLGEREQRAVLSGAAAHARTLLGLTSEGPGPDPLAVIHGLYWLAGNLSDQAPAVLAIDDLQWADAHTVRWLIYMAARIREMPILLLLAARPPEARAEELSGLIGDEPVIALAPLAVEGVAEVVRSQFGRAGEAGFVKACHKATGGNPFYLRELLRAAIADGIAPTEEQAARVPQLGPREVARSIVVRLGRLGPRARRLADAVAVLGSDAEIRHAAALGNLSIQEALDAWDTLAGADVLVRTQPLEFIHPIARTAVYKELAVGERTHAHRTAAEMLVRDGAPARQVAMHALACEPLGDPRIVEWLRSAARDALASSTPDAAASYLHRALSEPPSPESRVQVQFELGQALIGVNTAAAAAAFASAAVAASGQLALLAHRWCGYSLAYAGRMRDSIASFDAAIKLSGSDAELAMHLGATRDFYASWWADDPDRDGRQRRLQDLASGLDGASAGERRVLAAAAISLVHTGAASADSAIELTRRASAARLTWLDLEDGSETASAVGNTLTICDDPSAVGLYTDWLDEVRSQGWTINVGGGYFQRALIRFRRGELLEAEADARTSWEVISQVGEAAATVYWWSAAALLQVLIARGSLDEAGELVEATGLGAKPLEVVICPWPGVLLGELALARGEVTAGIEMLLEAGAWLETRGFHNPSYIPWRALAAPALVTTGRASEARELIEPAMQRARAFGAPWALGMALRAGGTVEQGVRGIELLRQAVAVLETSGCRVEHAHALLELGAALRRTNRRAEAREYLRVALDIAHRSGATPLTNRVQQELSATGARPRRTMLSGAESLTASERRVAELAATGMSNPEIAQALFVTRKTIESHLGHVYLKLDINSRQQLPRALSPELGGT
jgi:DNA-binding CsgD family transcriptional regulator